MQHHNTDFLCIELHHPHSSLVECGRLGLKLHSNCRLFSKQNNNRNGVFFILNSYPKGKIPNSIFKEEFKRVSIISENLCSGRNGDYEAQT
jgi:hypothetical protein